MSVLDLVIHTARGDCVRSVYVFKFIKPLLGDSSFAICLGAESNSFRFEKFNGLCMLFVNITFLRFKKFVYLSVFAWLSGLFYNKFSMSIDLLNKISALLWELFCFCLSESSLLLVVRVDSYKVNLRNLVV